MNSMSYGNVSEVSDDDEVVPSRKKRKIEKDLLMNSLLENIDDISDNEAINPPPSTNHGEENEEHSRIPNLTPDQESMVKQIYKDRKKYINGLPIIDLKDIGEEASLSLSDDIRYPIFFPDILEVLSHVQNNLTSTRWIHIKKASKIENIIILVIEGIGLEDYEHDIESCPSLKSYTVGVEFVPPITYGDKIERVLSSYINIEPEFQRIKNVYDGSIAPLDLMCNLKQNDASGTNSFLNFWNESKGKVKLCSLKRSIKPALSISLSDQDNFSRLYLLMTISEMANNNYPLPHIPKYNHFVKTKDEYDEVTEMSPMFGLDCEMCETAFGSELTRISIVNELHEVVYEKLVKPYNKITNYVTKYSGITKKMLLEVTTRLPDVQQEIRALLPSDAILIGQSLNFDLIALKMTHPYVIDTSVIYNLSGVPNQKVKLVTLVAEFLSERIQSSKHGHDSIEDGLAALKLVQLKLKKTFEWGHAALGYVRSEAESRKAHKLLLERDKNPPEIKYRMALNALVDEPLNFTPPLEDYSLWLISRKETSKKSNLKKNTNFTQVEDIDLTSLMKKTKNNKINKQRQLLNTFTKGHHCSYSEVAIISSSDMLKSYNKYMRQSMSDKVLYHSVDKNSTAINTIHQLDSEEKKRIIIAHIKTSNIYKVEKVASKFMNKCKGNSLICLCLAGNKDLETTRGALFLTIPSTSNLTPVKELIYDYLKSVGWKNKVKTKYEQ